MNLGDPIPGQQCLRYQNGNAEFCIWNGTEWVTDILGPMTEEEFAKFVEDFPIIWDQITKGEK